VNTAYLKNTSYGGKKDSKRMIATRASNVLFCLLLIIRRAVWLVHCDFQIQTLNRYILKETVSVKYLFRACMHRIKGQFPWENHVA